MTKHITILAEDTSGDVYASWVIKKLRAKKIDFSCDGIAGDLARREGMTLWIHNSSMNFMGMTQVIANASKIRTVWRLILDNLNKKKPDLLILIDYPGLNMRIAKQAKAMNIPILYFVPPQVWAWGRKRIQQLRTNVDQIACLYPFEQDFFEKVKLPTFLVEHPLQITSQIMPLVRLKNSEPAHIVCLPGSRKQEIAKHLSDMLEACYILQNTMKREIRCSVVQAPAAVSILPIVLAWGDKLQISIIKNADKLSALKDAEAACVVSGTACFELALLGIPHTVVYKTGWINYFLARWLLAKRIRWISLTNLVNQKSVVKELIQHESKPENIAKELSRLITNQEARQSMHQDFARMRDYLSARAHCPVEKLIIDMLKD
ncbi:MAG: lipid-A-disaccharide synthase [Pseudomonadota bacterium]|nr:lipid-A-disaccharide synthase [Pseudomonadota bacterium]